MLYIGSLYIKYIVCKRERERERQKERKRKKEREREKERKRERERKKEREREKEGIPMMWFCHLAINLFYLIQ